MSFYIFFSLSLCSFVRKYLEVIDIPNIKFSLVIDFFKSTKSEKLQTINNFISLFNTPDNKDKMTMGVFEDSKSIKQESNKQVLSMEGEPDSSKDPQGQQFERDSGFTENVDQYIRSYVQEQKIKIRKHV